MVVKKASVRAEWDDEFESKIEEKVESWAKNCGKKQSFNYVETGSGAVYGLGFIGAVIYFISTATSFWDGILGILQAIVWPAFLVFEVLKSFNL